VWDTVPAVVTAESAYVPGRTLPAAWYTEPSWFELEHDRIFERSWQYVGWLGKLGASVHIAHGAGHYMTTSPGPVLDTIHVASLRTESR